MSGKIKHVKTCSFRHIIPEMAMLINKSTIIKGQKVILVPYKECHVPKYHEWMKSKELQELTASEPLSLEQEYQMQKSWQEDEEKCTFIILHKEKFESSGNEIDSMIGDTNLFFCRSEEDRLRIISAEAEIMIAEPWARRNKCGYEAMLLMFLYAINYLEIKEFLVKISFGNSPSISMFKKFGFIESSKSEIFQEFTFIKKVDANWLKWLQNAAGYFQIIVDTNN